VEIRQGWLPGSPPPRIDDTVGLEVVTFNVWGLPQWISGASLDRFERISKELDGLAPDLMLLQEVWTRQAKGALPKGEGWSIAASPEPLWPFHRNGLVTASRLPILSGEFRPFNRSSFPDSVATKGALKTTVQLANGERMNVWNVHLQAGSSTEIRSRQIDELVTWVEEARDGQAFDLIGGDFNCSPGSENFEQLHAGLGSTVQELGDVPYFATYDGLTGSAEKEEVLDHVFLRLRESVEVLGAEPKVAFTSEDLANRVSDHLGVSVSLSLAFPELRPLERWAGVAFSGGAAGPVLGNQLVVAPAD